MYKKTLIFLIIMMSISFISAKTIDETNFLSLGHSDFGVERGPEICEEYNYDKLATVTNSKIITNIVIENYIPVKNNLEINVYLNELLVKKITDSEILMENHIELSDNQLEKNQLKICITNSALPKVIISDKSTIGTYLIGEIKENVDFYQKILTDATYNSELLPIEIYAYNSGYDKLYIEIKHANETFLQNSNLETVSGQTNYTGFIEPGQTITLKYFLKANKNINFSTARAELKYTDDFKTEKLIYAAQETIKIKENETKIEVYVDIKKDTLVNNPTVGHIILKNISQTDIKNISIESNFDGKITISQRQIPVLKKFAIVEIPFEIITDDAGKYNLNTTVYYNLGEKENGINTQTIIINSDVKKDYVKEMIGIFLIITIAIYIWIVRL